MDVLYENYKIFFDNNTVSINVAEDAKKSFTITGIDTKPLSIGREIGRASCRERV